MSIEQDIQALCAQADPLRALAEDDPAKGKLRGIVDKINALRAKQANYRGPVADEPPLDADFERPKLSVKRQ